MTDLRPILQDEPSTAERLLIASATLDRPPPGGRERALLALGLVAGVGATSASAGAATGAGAASPLGSLPTVPVLPARFAPADLATGIGISGDGGTTGPT